MTNRNLAIHLRLVEQKNALTYIIDDAIPCPDDEDEDGNIKLSGTLGKRLRKTQDHRIKEAVELRNVRTDTVVLYGPSKANRLTTYQRMCIKAFFLGEEYEDMEEEEEGLEADANSFDIPVDGRIFRSCVFNTTRRGDVYCFRATSSTMQRSNQLRQNSLVRYESENDRGNVESNFGEVLCFFSIHIPEECVYARRSMRRRNATGIKLGIKEKERGAVRDLEERELSLAYIRSFPAIRDGKLLYKGGRGQLKVIMASDIHELIGLLRKGRQEFIIRRHSALW